MPEQQTKTRLDVLLVERGLAESREKARRIIMAGEVTVENQLATKPGHRVPENVAIALKQKARYVSRGGDKLAAALDHFKVEVSGLVCADIGASTGGFTDCLLQNGAERVHAIDVGYGQLAWKLRQDERVVVSERVNARYLEALPEPVDFVCIDVSFISVKHILPNMGNWLKPGGQAIVLIKPQFEAGKKDVGKGGVVRDSEVHRRVLHQMLDYAFENGFTIKGLIVSPVRGPAGNVEFLLHLDVSGQKSVAHPDIVDAVLIDSQTLAAPTMADKLPDD